MEKFMRFRDRVVLLTGAAGGIGTATARKFIGEGAKVALLDVNQDALQELAATLGPKAIHVRCDVSDEASLVDAITTSVRRLGAIDVGVLNAGISGKRQALEDTDVADFDRLMGVNARSVFLGLKHLFPVMRDHGGGSIVVTASTEALRGNGGLASYVASKHAVVGLARTAALEWAAHNIRVNCVNPAPVDTPMLRSIERGLIEAGVTGVRERYASRIPLGRYATPDEVAGFIAFLASDEASFSTGGAYLVDGGVMAGVQALTA
jgi:NAD(P)-dependent dehydrogenase (short-subunit alcohol dehydrogenase family)